MGGVRSKKGGRNDRSARENATAKAYLLVSPTFLERRPVKFIL